MIFFSCHDLIFKYKNSILRSCLSHRLVVGNCLETSCAIWKQFKLGVCQDVQKSCKYWSSPHFMIVQYIVLISNIFCYNLLSKLLFICMIRLSCLCGKKRWENNFKKISSVYIWKPSANSDFVLLEVLKYIYFGLLSLRLELVTVICSPIMPVVSAKVQKTENFVPSTLYFW